MLNELQASDVSLRPDPEIISKSVATTLSVLEAAAKHDTVTRFVLTSSASAALFPQPGQPGIIIDSSKLLIASHVIGI